MNVAVVSTVIHQRQGKHRVSSPSSNPANFLKAKDAHEEDHEHAQAGEDETNHAIAAFCLTRSCEEEKTRESSEKRAARQTASNLQPDGLKTVAVTTHERSAQS